MSKRILVSVACTVGVLLVAWTGWWFHASNLALDRFQDWVAEQRADHYDIVFHKVDTGGYPLSVQLTVHRFGMSAPLRAWSVSADELTVSFQPWRFDRYNIDSDQPIRLSAVAIEGSRETPIRIDHLTGDYRFERVERRHRLRLLASDVTGPEGLSARQIGITGARPFDKATDRQSPILSTRLEVVDAQLPGLFPPELSDRLAAAVLTFDLSGPEPGPEASFLKGIADWRDAGGLIDVTEIALVWQDLNLAGDGTVGLDEEMRPLASFAVRAAGLNQTARRFQDAGLIDGRTRRYIELGTGLLSMGSSESGGVVRFPISVQDGMLNLGPVPVAEISPIFPGSRSGSNSMQGALVPKVETFPDLPPPPTVSDGTLNAAPSFGTSPAPSE